MSIRFHDMPFRKEVKKWLAPYTVYINSAIIADSFRCRYLPVVGYYKIAD
jgi:hypothetical protein